MAYTGLTAKLSVGEKDVAYISNWSIDETRDVIEITKLGSNEKEVVPSLYYWSASAEGAADFTTSSGQEDLRNAMLNDTAITVKFYLNDDTYLTGTAVITAFSLSISTEDKATVSISITGNGKLTLTKPGA